MDLLPEDIDDILAVLDSSNYEELRIETGRFTLTLRRSKEGWSSEQEILARPNVLEEAVSQPPSTTASPPARETTRRGAKEVVAPLPGVFYRAPKPGAAPFVELGTPVEADTVVGLMETMKLMNPVPAGTKGTVSEICVENATAAEQGSVLMWLRPDGTGPDEKEPDEKGPDEKGPGQA